MIPATYQQILDAVYPTSGLSDNIMLVKLRTDAYNECEVWVPIEANTANYARHLLTSRFNATNSVASESGTARLYRAELGIVAPRALDSYTPGTAASLATTTVAWAAATVTNSGNWVSAGTVNGLPLCHYTTTKTTEHVIYTVTVPTNGRIACIQPANTSNGGLIDVKIMQSGVEIPSANYSCALVGGVRQFNLGLASDAVQIELAYGLTGTFTVDFTLDAATGAATRLWSCQVITTPALAWNTPGETGYWVAANPATVGGNTGINVCDWWASVSYTLTNATRVTARVWQTTNCGQTLYSVFDSLGNIVAKQVIDGFGGGVLTEFVLIENPVPTTYSIVTQGLGTANVNSTGNKFADGGVYAYNTMTPGVLGTDPPSITPNSMLAGNGNLEHAISTRRVGSPTSQLSFSGGTHGGEIQGTPIYEMDGVVIPVGSGTVGEQWIGKKLTISWLSGCAIGFTQSGASISQSGGLATVVLPLHGFTSGNLINISGAFAGNLIPQAYNGDQTITVVDVNTFTYACDPTAVSPATGGITITRRNDYWATFTLVQTIDKTGYTFMETITVAENCFIGESVEANNMGPSPCAIGASVGADTGLIWEFIDGSEPVRVTGQTDVSTAVPKGSTLVLQTNGGKYFTYMVDLGSSATASQFTNRSDTFVKNYQLVYNTATVGGDPFAPGVVWNNGGRYRIVPNARGVSISGVRTAAVGRAVATGRVAAGTRLGAGVREPVYSG